jgi:hypothetical protein
MGDAGGPIDSRLGDLCNHVGFTDVAAPRGSWLLFEPKKSLDSRLREGAERSVDSSLNLYLWEKRAKTDLLYLKFNYLIYICTRFWVNRTTNKRAMNKNRKQGRHSVVTQYWKG